MRAPLFFRIASAVSGTRPALFAAGVAGRKQSHGRPFLAAAGALAFLAGCSAASADLPARIVAPKDQAEMALIPAGPFTYGMNRAEMKTLVTQTLKEKVVDIYLEEHPKQQKSLKAFYIDKFEVTNEKYARFVKETGHRLPRYGDYPQFNGQRQPVVGVGWADAETYCRWANKRLPTEEEWEKAARGTDGRIWTWGNKPDDMKYNGRKRGYYAPINVGNIPSGDSPYGVSDMAGNVWEMTSSRWDDQSRVMKGGSFLNTNADVRASVRWAAADEDKGANWLGFRCAMDTAPLK